MIDEETMTNEDNTPEPEPTPLPGWEPVPIPVPEPDPAPDPEPTPLPAAPSMEVVTVEDLLGRLAGNREEEEEETEEPGEVPDFSDNLPAVVTDDGPIEVVGMDTVLKRLETIQGTVDHPALTTPFEDYTVTEGLLLLLFLSVFVLACVKLLKGGFAWLR